MTKNNKKTVQKATEPKKKSVIPSKNSKGNTDKEVKNKSIKLKVTENTTTSKPKAKSLKTSEATKSKKTLTQNTPVKENKNKNKDTVKNLKTSTSPKDKQLNAEKIKVTQPTTKNDNNNKTSKEKNAIIKPKKEKKSDNKTESKSSSLEQKLPEIIPTNDYDLNKVDLDFENEVYDEADIASALEMGFIAQALEAHKAKVAKETHPDFDGESCIDCGEQIPELRLSMGRIRCVYCQEALERKNKLHGR